MIKQGFGVLPDEFFVLSARRLHASYAYLMSAMLHGDVTVSCVNL